MATVADMLDDTPSLPVTIHHKDGLVSAIDWAVFVFSKFRQSKAEQLSQQTVLHPLRIISIAHLQMFKRIFVDDLNLLRCL